MACKRIAAALVVGLVYLGAEGVGFAELTRVGGEFQVNVFTTGIQRSVAVESSGDGAFVVVWKSYGQDGGSYGVFRRRYDSAGVALGSELLTNSFTSGSQDAPAVARGASTFVVAWESASQDGVGGDGIFARVFNNGSGNPHVPEFQVNSFTTLNQNDPAVAMAADGSFVVSWSSLQDGNESGVFARRFDASGVGLGVEFQVNTYTTSFQLNPLIAVENDGDFVVAWISGGQDGNLSGVFGRRFDSAGTPRGSEFRVNTHTTGAQYRASIARDGDGDFAVVWQSNGQDGDSFGVFARRFSSSGTALAVELQVNSYTTGFQGIPDIGMRSDGAFVVAWDSPQDGDGNGVFARAFSALGAPQAVELQVNTYTTGSQGVSDIGIDTAGRFVVAWQSTQDGSSDGVFAQRFANIRTLDIDADGTVGALTDGLLVLRFLFGFTGATLVSGALSGECTRCDASAIATYLQSLV